VNRIIQAVSFAFALLIVGGAVYFGYLLITANNQTRLAVLTAVVTVGTLVYTQNLTSRREITSRQFAKKSEAYEEVMRTIGSLMNSNRKNQQINEDELVDQLSAILPKLMVWVGPQVLNAWKLMATPTDEPMGGIKAGSALIAALRSELGHKDDSSLGPFGALSAMMKHDEDGNII
jgi:phosphodiesterase/alkaline phosphatase D-like protein